MRIENIRLDDLATLALFKSWIRKNISFHKKNKIKKKHLLIYLDYIAEQVKENQRITNQAWFDQLAILKKRTENE